MKAKFMQFGNVLSRSEMSVIMGGTNRYEDDGGDGRVGGAKPCSCLPGDPGGTCSSNPGICNCGSYDLNDSNCS